MLTKDDLNYAMVNFAPVITCDGKIYTHIYEYILTYDDNRNMIKTLSLYDADANKVDIFAFEDVDLYIQAERKPYKRRDSRNILPSNVHIGNTMYVMEQQFPIQFKEYQYSQINSVRLSYTDKGEEVVLTELKGESDYSVICSATDCVVLLPDGKTAGINQLGFKCGKAIKVVEPEPEVIQMAENEADVAKFGRCSSCNTPLEPIFEDSNGNRKIAALFCPYCQQKYSLC